MRPLNGFSKWHINIEHFSLENENAEEIFVEPRLLKLLHYLTENANKVVMRNEIFEHVWGDVMVTDESLSKAIFDLRKFLSANFTDAPQIQTIRKVGYKLETRPRNIPPLQRVLRVGAKVVAFILIFALAFSILIRAIRYDN